MIRPRKRLGQNFLQDPNTARKIVAAVSAGPRDPVLEIGGGTGALTLPLAERFENLSVVEVDPRAASVLRETGVKATIIEKNILDIDYGEYVNRGADGAGKLHIVGNLPYYLTSEILFGIIDRIDVIAEAVLMMQYEVAMRLVADQRTKSYGILSVAVQLIADAEILFPVSRNVFYPKPDVRSAVIRITPLEDRIAACTAVDAKFLRSVVRTAFNQRRKTLRNSLRTIWSEKGKSLPGEFVGRRAEELSPRDFIELTRYLASP